jgi:hypothetical protein
MDPIPDTMLLGKSGNAGNRTRDDTGGKMTVFIHYKKSYDLLRKEVLYNIFNRVYITYKISLGV